MKQGKWIKELFVLITRRKTGLIGLILISIPIIMATLPQYLAPYDPYKRVAKPFEPPSLLHLLGTNDMGQDILSELIYGARISLLIGVTATVATVLIGGIIGLIAGYYGGFIGEALMAITNVFLLTPILPFMVFLASILGQSYVNIIITITAFSWPGIARYIWAHVISIKTLPYIEVAKALGASNYRVMFKHVLPQVIPSIIALVMLRIGYSMIAEAALCFMGLGDPVQKSWGTMIYWARRTGTITAGAWWWIIAPGLMITLTVLGFTQIGYVLEEQYNPRLRRY
ncbi:MAG: ABC transporter permease [Desulfurococcaceae archaeon]